MIYLFSCQTVHALQYSFKDIQRRKNTPLGKRSAGVFWQRILLKPFVGVYAVACCSTNIEKKKKKHPSKKASRRGVLVSNQSKPLVDQRYKVFQWAADLLQINQPIALFLTVAEWQKNDAAEPKLTESKNFIGSRWVKTFHRGRVYTFHRGRNQRGSEGNIRLARCVLVVRFSIPHRVG